jgi:predicted nucleotidyltransferase
MDINDAFNTLQKVADAGPAQVAEARRRRDLFAGVFATEGDVIEVVASGSLARSTQRVPLNDVDVAVVFDASTHPDWGLPGDSASAALDYLRTKVAELLGSGGLGEVRLAVPRNHSVKCWLDDPDADRAFTVDAMPALRQPGGELLVPEKKSEYWIRTHPEYLIEMVRERQAKWAWFRPLVRVLKLWNDRDGGVMKSLTVEILALNNLPAETNRPRAVQRFFQAAVNAIDLPIVDPSGFCGEIQPDLDRVAARERLDAAASWAWHAVNSQDAGETDRAACLWRNVFGDAFPEPEDGCPVAAEEDDGSGTFYIGTGAAAAGMAAAGGRIGVDRPRPVTDAPQG